MSFTHDDVQRIIQLLNTSHFDELHLEADGIKLDLRRNGAGAAPLAASVSSAPTRSVDVAAPAPAALPSVSSAASGAGASSVAGLLDVRAPMLGVFYRSPKPGADPFVAPGVKVKPDTVIGIIEVMKLMNSVAAEVSGEVVEVLAKDGDLVEYDQVLMRVRATQG
ncbi:acetyl-CoA carboxylase biotin carboxyl carrier protein [Pusillimonas sp. NJUB218]|uniref:acetyl-CoA carboxylase biotin carboxyl carrier protein n=1 Tax=Pusillimonas sp. NJUB218 TaxID=2023230 RepID=UPI000F4C0A46|nr:acetyl-CoA carboxylase biotin carboxyl carrier protein [Pusillimonas sp. NJUB218]ROT46515.1 acetyl-CoA carboxylase, biotin carboxyl carrier protein [Pusillimonas sp. NJUB218]